MEELNKIIASNLVLLRKKSGLTQQELAKQFNYSDKTVSKWELGRAIPSVDVLKDLADYYNVSMDYMLTRNETVADVEKKKIKKQLDRRILVLLLANSVFMLIATCVFVWTCLDASSTPYWQVFIWGASMCFFVSAITIWRVWKENKVAWLIIASLFTWVFITAFYTQFLSDNVWYIYFIGIPVEAILALITKIKSA